AVPEERVCPLVQRGEAARGAPVRAGLLRGRARAGGTPVRRLPLRRAEPGSCRALPAPGRLAVEQLSRHGCARPGAGVPDDGFPVRDLRRYRRGTASLRPVRARLARPAAPSFRTCPTSEVGHVRKAPDGRLIGERWAEAVRA